MDCPRCGLADVTAVECPRCGVVLAKARARREGPSPGPAAGAPAETRPVSAEVVASGSPSSHRLAVAFVLIFAIGAASWFALGRRRAPVAGAAGAAPVDVEGDRAEAPAHGVTLEPPPPIDTRVESAATHVEELVAAAQVVGKDRDAAAALAARIDARLPVGPDDLRVAEDLFARYPEQARGLLESALVASAVQERAARRYTEATALLERAVAISPQSVDVRRGILAVRTDAADWLGVEAAARALLGLVPDDGAASRSLAYALVRQDRTREAMEALAAYLDGRADPEAAALLDRLRRERSAEGGFEEQRLAHFHVRYDGDAHEDVGREILRVLDRHYASLRTAFDHEPRAPIPVILFSSRSYYDATGAPAWSGGEFDHYDGRIRVPIGGLTASLTPDLEETLLHEVTHAFVTDLSAGLAPREIQEGLAQWTEGKRSAVLLGDRGLQALADGRIQGVTAFYLASLVLVEDLVAQRGRSGLNDLLAAMARTGAVDGAFQEGYGRTYASLQADTLSRLRQRHGS